MSLLLVSAVAIAGHGERVACPSCASCASQAPILESGRLPFPDEAGSGVDSCTLVNTSRDWDTYCFDNSIPDCPFLADSFFAQHTVVAVAIDTVTVRPCEGSSDPLWSLDCVTTPAEATVRVVKQRPGAGCLCSAIPQHLQRLFLASAIPKTKAKSCRACEESHTIDCPL